MDLDNRACTSLNYFVLFVVFVFRFQIMSNGLYSSIEHRARVNSEKERMSIAVFYNPRFDAEISPLTTFQNPPLFTNILMEDYFKDFFTQSFNGKSHLDRMKIPTTHQPNPST